MEKMEKLTFSVLCCQKPCFLTIDSKMIEIHDEQQILFHKLRVCLDHQIQWLMDTDLKGFSFQELRTDEEGDDRLITSEVIVEGAGMWTIKDYLANKIMFNKVQDFYFQKTLLGKGSTAKVSLMVNKRTKIEYAVKCIDKKYLKNHGKEALFEEIRIHSSLDHPQIAKLYEVFEGEHTYYFVLDYLRGQSLESEIEQKGPFKEDNCRIIIKKILLGLQYIHEMHIMHRDLKPENIIFARENDYTSVKLIDFGLATNRYYDELHIIKCGTPGYIAPEILRNQEYDYYCDIYSVGAVFYKMLTGKELYNGADNQEIINHNRKSQPDLSEIQSQLAQIIICRMLEVNPLKRASATELLGDDYFRNVYSSNQKMSFFQSLKQKVNMGKSTSSYQLYQTEKETSQYQMVEEYINSLAQLDMEPVNNVSEHGSLVTQPRIFQNYNKPVEIVPGNDLVYQVTKQHSRLFAVAKIDKDLI